MTEYLKKNIFIVLFFGLLAASLLAPIASNQYLPKNVDFANHAALITQAKMALDEGQFPIRVAPWQHQGWRNPYFQFYAATPYMLGAVIYKWFSPSNPYVVYKIMSWLAIFLAGIYMFRLIHWLTKSKPVSVLTSVVYMMSPYFMINVNVRAAFTEALAEGLVPLVLFYSLRFFLTPTLRNALLTVLAWFLLLNTHLITFVYTSFFFGLFCIFLFLDNFASGKNLLKLGLIYFFTFFLAAWYVVPILSIEKYLYINLFLCNPMYYAWLTKLPNLISVSAVSPMPLPGNGQLQSPIYPAIGWPIIFAVGVCCYSFFQNKTSTNNIFIRPLLILFFIGFFMVWSPIDFWSYLPEPFSIVQFSYRLLTQVMWIGALIFAWAIIEMFSGKMEWKHVLVGLFMIGIANSSWLITNQSSSLIPGDIAHHPDLGYGQNSYLVNQKKLTDNFLVSNIQLPLVSQSNWLILNRTMMIPVNLLHQSMPTLQLNGFVPANLFKSPLNLKLFINGKNVASKTLSVGSTFQWNIPLTQWSREKNEETISIEFKSDKHFLAPFEEWMPLTEERQHAVKVNSLRLINFSTDVSVLPVKTVQKFCLQVKTKTICKINVTAKENLLQLPVFYFPQLLDVIVDGKRMDYMPLAYQIFVLTGLRLSPGDHIITVEFVGIRWANWISIITWTCFLILFVAVLVENFRYAIQNKI